MKSSTFLRIASVITFLYFAGHTAGIPWTPAVGPGEAPVLEAMKAHSFNVLALTGPIGTSILVLASSSARTCWFKRWYCGSSVRWQNASRHRCAA